MIDASRGGILVIDDDHDVRAVIAQALTRAGLDVIEASGGADGLKIIRGGGIAVVVCDLGMPSMNGLQVVHALREQPDTATLPFILMTGSADSDAVIDALDSGADDFLAKPIRLDELVARVRAHMRTQTVWHQVVEQELATRAAIVSALGQVSAAAPSQDVAAQVVTTLGERMDVSFCSILGIAASGRVAALATYDRVNGMLRGGNALPPGRSRALLERAASGPWTERRPRPGPGEAADAFWASEPRVVARAPLYAGDRMIAILVLGSATDDVGHLRGEEARLLAAAIDFAGVVGAIAGSALGERTEAEAQRGRLQQILSNSQFTTVYQPIVDLATEAIVGWEALTRFEDGAAPDLRFAEARANDLGVEYELAAIKSAIAGGRVLGQDRMLTVNVSPTTILEAGRRLATALEDANRPIVLELSEHAEIKDYPAVRRALERHLAGVDVAVDDAGAGYASLRHLLELRPALAKIDISLVRGIHIDPVRQALISGLCFYAHRSGCRLVAEGVELVAEQDVLRGLGVELGQGYLFGRPGPVEGARPT